MSACSAVFYVWIKGEPLRKSKKTQHAHVISLNLFHSNGKRITDLIIFLAVCHIRVYSLVWQCLAALGSCRLVLALFLRSINAFDMFKESLGGLIKYLYDKMGARLGEGMEKVWWVEVLGMGSTVDVNLCSEKKRRWVFDCIYTSTR